MATKKNKADDVAERVAALVGAGKSPMLATVDFSDPNRPKTCLEVDFPILPVNQIAAIEGNAGKPVYQMSKWWARRRSSVFRAMLIAAATKAPDDEQLAAKTVWDAYYANHQKRGLFSGLKVSEIFMGGGTTVVEGSRLGMSIEANDLNPVAWLVVKNELADVKRPDVQRLLDALDQSSRAEVLPFYAIDCPRGHLRKWTSKSTGEVMPSSFDPASLPPTERANFEYEGPELLHVFWAKHGPCSATACDHRTPVMTSPVIAVKELSVKSWPDYECSCGETFDIEMQSPRMAPAAPLVIAATERAFAAMDAEGRFRCPHCGTFHQDHKARVSGSSMTLGKSKNKSISLTLLVHPDWLKGSPATGPAGETFGGSATDDPESTSRWYRERAKSLSFIEVRGELPDEVECPTTGKTFSTSYGTVPKKSTFTCQEPTCGREQDVLDSIKATGKTGPVSPYAYQGHCPECDRTGELYGGRFFTLPDLVGIDNANREWSIRKDHDLAGFWPTSELPYGFMTHHLQGGVPNHGFTHWWKMFNPRQLLTLSRMLKAIVEEGDFDWKTREYVLGVFQQYLRNQNMFCFWHKSHDHFAPHLSNNNFHPKSTTIELGGTIGLGYGPWKTTATALFDALSWSENPWELVSKDHISALDPALGKLVSGKSEKVRPGDLTRGEATTLTCRSSTDLANIGTGTQDMVITDPPFGGLLHYAELADFFYVWLRLVLKEKYPDIFSGEYTPKTLEAVSNKARHPDDADAFYERLLTACWAEAHRILKPGGLLAFTFHHSEDEPWVGVLKSLFDAGFYLEATYPIRSDETKGDGEFGSKTIEYDIIHVCRKRVDDPTPISWAKLRRKIVDDVRDLKGLLEQHQASGLPRADLEVIRRGKALEYYSRHYGHVYVEKGREFTLLEALAGIHQLLDDERDESGVAPPVLAEVHSRQFLRIFDKSVKVDRNDMVKYLRGTGTAPSLFEAYGWCDEEKKVYNLCDPLEFAKGWRGKHRKGMSRDLDQTLFLVGACFKDSGLRVDETLNNPNFDPHPAVPDLLDWMSNRGGTAEIQAAARVAKQLYSKWLGENKARIEAVRQQFDLFGEATA